MVSGPAAKLAAGCLVAVCALILGAGQQPARAAGSVTFAPVAVAFGPHTVGSTSAAQTVTLTNGTDAPVTVNLVTAIGDYTVTSDLCSGMVVNPLGTCQVGLAFTPTDFGSRPGSLSFDDDAPGAPQQVLLSGTGAAPQPSVSFSRSGLDFGSATVGTTTATKSIVATSNGPDPLNLGQVSTSGDFAIVNDGCSYVSLTGGSTCQVDVAFSPTVTGAETGSLTFTDDARNSPQSISLSGVGTPAIPQLTISPSTLDFGPVSVGGSSEVRAITITSTGTAPVIINAVLDYAEFFPMQLDNCSGATLQPGDSCTVTAQFNPGAPIAENGTLTIDDSAGGHIIPVTGSGTCSSNPVIGGTLPVDPSRSALSPTGAIGFPNSYCYHVTSNLVIPTGTVLAIDPAVRLNFDPGIGVYVQGYLQADTNDATRSILFTSAAANPVPGQWLGIYFQAHSDGSLLNNVIVQYAGSGGGGHYFGIRIDTARPTLAYVSLRNTSGDGVDVVNGACPTLNHLSVSDSSNWGLYWTTGLECDLGLASLAYDRNGNQNRIYFAGVMNSSGTLHAVAPDYYVAGTINVPSGQTLTLEPGIRLRFGPGAGVIAAGSLISDGTAAPILFSTATAPAQPGQWAGVYLLPGSDGSVIKQTRVEYAGGGQAGAFFGARFEGTTPLIAGLTVDQSNGDGIQSVAGNPTMTGVTVSNGTGTGMNVMSGCPNIRGASLQNNAGFGLALRSGLECDLGGLPGLSYMGNGGGNRIFLNGAMAASARVRSVGAQYYVDGGIRVPSGTVLTLDPGVTMTFRDGTGLTVYGSLSADGTSAQISLDSATQGAPAGSWAGVYLGAGAPSSVLNNVRIAHAGYNLIGSRYGIRVDTSAAESWSHLTFVANAGAGLEVDGSATVSVRGSNFIDSPSGVGVINYGGTVDATGSYWGNASGPNVAGNPTGSGDAIQGVRSGFVSYKPYATAMQ